MIKLLAGYQKSWLPCDLLAGVSVAAVALPIAIAYAQLAGMPPVYGLYASLLPLVAYALLGSSRQLIIAPDAATCAIVAAVVAPLAGDTAEHRIVRPGVSLQQLQDSHCHSHQHPLQHAHRVPHHHAGARSAARESRRGGGCKMNRTTNSSRVQRAKTRGLR